MSPKSITPDIAAPLNNAGAGFKNIKKSSGAGFGDQLKKYLSEVNELQQVADKKVEELASGQNANLHETLIAVEKAGISFRMVMQVRNKIISAYEEVMRMQF
ncbi:MAG: flagellar hook-basal body complex protein FliE [Deltaproteobacteria bacterium]|jgi:flagellar hook-basal body complex protein FliE|nr:flagellar hook-basal body complex protein FliE [Deltaproteobacteria bacterium]MDP2799144.1 flagellar hook-basal body complex protein FliE [Deltaproteobacteria bacterium]MDP3028659.1 flagellar hook-basal body complex protein FliE [Deltaproteobacteria bacterium]